jgi:hypothetical protein
LVSELYCYLVCIGRLLTSEFCCYFHMYEKYLWQSNLRISCDIVQCLLLRNHLQEVLKAGIKTVNVFNY